MSCSRFILIGTYSHKQILGLFRDQACPEFEGGANAIYVAESQPPLTGGGKEVILLSVCERGPSTRLMQS